MNPDFVSMLRPFLKFAGDRELSAGSRLRDLGLDSMQEVELLFAVEETFGVQVPDGDLVDATFETAGSLWAVVDRLRAPLDLHAVDRP